MAKEELGIKMGEGVDMNDILIDTDTGKVIKSDNDLMDNGKNKTKQEDTKVDLEDKNNLIDIDDGEEGKDKNVPKGGDPNDDTSTSSLPYVNVFVKALQEKGILSDLDLEKSEEEIKDIEDVIDLIRKEEEKRAAELAQEKLEKLPEDLRSLLNENEETAKHIPTLLDKKKEIETFKSISQEQIEDNVELQKKIIADNLYRQGLSENKIEKIIQRTEESGELEEEAKDAYKDTIEILMKEEEALKEKALEEAKVAEKAREEQLKKLKDSIFSADHIVDGIKLTEKEKKRLFDSMTKIVGKDDNGNPLNEVMMTRAKNPLAFERALHYYHSLGLFNMDKNGNFKPDLSKIKVSAKSSAIDELNNALKTGGATNLKASKETRMDKDAIKKSIEAMKLSLPL